MTTWKSSENEKPAHAQAVIVKFENTNEIIFGKFIFPSKNEPEKYLETYHEFHPEGFLDTDSQVYFKSDVFYDFNLNWKWMSIKEFILSAFPENNNLNQ